MVCMSCCKGARHLFFLRTSFSSLTLASGQSVLYIFLGIKLPSIPVSILYSHISVLCMHFVFNCAVITDLTLWRLCYQLFFFIVLVYDMNSSSSFSSAILRHLSALTSAYLLDVVNSPPPGTALVMGWTPFWLVCAPQYFQLLFVSFWSGIVLLLMLFMASNSLLSFVAYINVFCFLGDHLHLNSSSLG